jgi:hypothetical protein
MELINPLSGSQQLGGTVHGEKKKPIFSFG